MYTPRADRRRDAYIGLLAMLLKQIILEFQDIVKNTTFLDYRGRSKIILLTSYFNRWGNFTLAIHREVNFASLAAFLRLQLSFSCRNIIPLNKNITSVTRARFWEAF